MSLATKVRADQKGEVSDFRLIRHDEDLQCSMALMGQRKLLPLLVAWFRFLLIALRILL